MPEYLSPGVYIEEIDAGPRPIAAVSTSTAGMVGVTVRGPTAGKPRLVTSFLDFQRTFGGFLPEPPAALRDTWQNLANDEGGRWWLFPLAVRGFFDNGGQRLFVKRVAAGGANPSTGSFQGGLVSAVTGNAASGTSDIELEHVVGIDTNTQLTILYRDPANPLQQGPVGVSAYDAQRRRVTLAAPLSRELRAGRDLVQIKGPQAPTALTVTASAPGTWGDAIDVLVRPVVTTFGLMADPAEGDPFSTQVATLAVANSPTVIVRRAPGLAVGPPRVPPGNFFVRIGPRRFEVSNVAAVAGQPDQVALTLQGNPPHALWNPGLAVRRVRRANPGGAGPSLRVAGARGLYVNAIVELDNGTAKQTLRVTGVEDDVVTFGANANADYFETDKLHLVEAELVASYTDELGITVDETFSNLRLAQNDQRGAEARINEVSRLVTVTQPVGLANEADLRLPVPASLTNGPGIRLASGDDDLGSLTVDDFVGVDLGSGRRTGITALEDIDQVAIAAVPGMWASTIQASLIQHCELLKDRFAILDPPDPLDTQEILEFRTRFDTRYAALYYPWLMTRDPSLDRDVNVPPSGHMAGIYARVDVDRGVHKAPANVVVRGIRLEDGFAQDITKRHQDLLNPKGINALRFFPDLGHRVWGARTLSSDTTWKYINVRRLFIQIEESIEEGTQWVVFEPNDEPLWALVRQTISNFLTGFWSNGALFGATAEEAFFVACDRSTMTQDDIDNGRLICVIGIAPVFPAEFVIFRIQQKTRELQPA
jgi:uncharacterized protein